MRPAPARCLLSYPGDLEAADRLPTPFRPFNPCSVSFKSGHQRHDLQREAWLGTSAVGMIGADLYWAGKCDADLSGKGV